LWIGSKTRICWRGDSHYARPEVMDWCEENGVNYIFGLAGNDVLHAKLGAIADDLCVRRAEAGEEKRRTWTEVRYAAKSWTQPRRVVARLEATTQGFDARYIVTTLEGSAGHHNQTRDRVASDATNQHACRATKRQRPLHLPTVVNKGG
jgi:hypothetical protein